MRHILGFISVMEIRKQINAANLKLLQLYSEALDTDISNIVEGFLSNANFYRVMQLTNHEGLTVKACVLGLGLEDQYKLHKLVEALKLHLRDVSGNYIRCDLTENELEIEFWTYSWEQGHLSKAD